MKIVEQGIIYNGTEENPCKRYAGVPSLAMLTNASMLCSFKVGSAKISVDDNVLILRSADEGKTWKMQGHNFDTRYEGVNGSIHSCYIREYRRGSLMASCCWVDRSNPDLPYANPATGGCLPIKYLLGTSTDEGRTWSRFRPISMEPYKEAGPSCGVTALKNGTLILPYENWKQWDDIRGNYSGGVVLSKDEGRTWSWPVIIACDPFAEKYFWDNKAAVNPGTGEILVTLWTVESGTYKNLDVHVVRGSMEGRQWTYPVATGIKGQTAVPVFLDEKTVFLAYVCREHGSMEAVLSYDGGKTWETQEALRMYQTPTKAQQSGDIYGALYGAPDAVRITKDTVGVAFYAGDQTHLSIHYVKIKM